MLTLGFSLIHQPPIVVRPSQRGPNGTGLHPIIQRYGASVKVFLQ
jgi:hypothetical protein